MKSVMLVLGLLTACGGEPAAPAAAPSAPKAAAPKAAAPTPPPEAVGPDGPESIVVPALASIPTDAASVEAGTKVYNDRGCGGCHKFGEKVVGPDLKGVLTRRTVPWVERMILDPGTMVKQDPQAKELFKATMVEMPKQNVTEQEIGPLLAYIKSQGG